MSTKIWLFEVNIVNSNLEVGLFLIHMDDKVTLTIKTHHTRINICESIIDSRRRFLWSTNLTYKSSTRGFKEQNQNMTKSSPRATHNIDLDRNSANTSIAKGAKFLILGQMKGKVTNMSLETRRLLK